MHSFLSFPVFPELCWHNTFTAAEKLSKKEKALDKSLPNSVLFSDDGLGDVSRLALVDLAMDEHVGVELVLAPAVSQVIGDDPVVLLGAIVALHLDRSVLAFDVDALALHIPLLASRISRIGKYRLASSSAASSGARGISCTELPRALPISRRNGVVPIGNDAISPRGAMTKPMFGFADPANPCLALVEPDHALRVDDGVGVVIDARARGCGSHKRVTG